MRVAFAALAPDEQVRLQTLKTANGLDEKHDTRSEDIEAYDKPIVHPMARNHALHGIDGTKRAARSEARLPEPALDRFAYAGFVYVGDTDEEGVDFGSKRLWFLNTSLKQAPQFSKFLPDRMPPEMAPQVYRTKPRSEGTRVARPADGLIGMTAEQAIQRQIMFAGNLDTVFCQIMAAYDALGGFGHLILIGRSGYLTHREAEKGIRMLANEVLPRVREGMRSRDG